MLFSVCSLNLNCMFTHMPFNINTLPKKIKAWSYFSHTPLKVWSFPWWTKITAAWTPSLALLHTQVDISQLPVHRRRKCWTAVCVDEVISSTHKVCQPYRKHTTTIRVEHTSFSFVYATIDILFPCLLNSCICLFVLCWVFRKGVCCSLHGDVKIIPIRVSPAC